MTANPSPQLSRTSILAWQALLLAGGVLVLAVIPFLSAEHSDFQDRIVGVTSLNLVNPKYRETVYILLVMAGMCVATSLFLRLRPQAADLTRNAHADHIIVLLAGCASANVVAYLIKNEALFLQAALLAALILGLRLLWHQRLASVASTSQENEFFLCIGLSWQITTCLFLFGSWNVDIAFSVAFTVLSGLAMSIVKKWHIDITAPRLKPIIMWVALLPILYVAAAELSYFSFQRDIDLEPAAVFALLSLLVLASTAVLPRAALNPVYILCAAILVSGIIINEYQDAISFQGKYDLFHYGERILPLQQWSSYGSLPFIDYLPIHGIFDALPHFIYQQLANSDPLEGMIWGNGYFTGWFMRAIAMFILFHFLSRIYPAKATFLLLWLLPTYHILDPYFCLLLIPAIRLLRLPQSTNGYYWWMCQWMIMGAIFLWRIDFGAILVVANTAIAIAYSWYIGRVSPLLQCFASGAIAALLIFVAMTLLVDELSVAEVLRQIQYYVVHQTAITSYEKFFDGMSPAVVTHYLVFPGSAVLVASLSLSRLLRRTTPPPQLALELLVVFLCAITLILSLRALHRHSVYEGSAKSYLFLLVMVAFFIRHYAYRLRPVAPIVLMAFIMASYLFLPTGELQPYKEVTNREAQWEYPITTSGAELPQWKAYAPRLTDTVTRYDGFLQFMDEALEDDQRFYDFSNAPMLYALADIKLPTYIFETVYHSSDTLQYHALSQLERLRSQNKLPFVVFRQNNQWDRLDRVDNAFRSYGMAEYIYRYYRPCVRINRFDLWVEKSLASKEACEARLEDTFPLSTQMRKRLWPIKREKISQFVNFGGVPYLWARHDTTEEQISDTMTPTRRQISPTSWQLTLSPEQQGCHESICYLDITVDSEEDSRLFGHFLGNRQFKMTLLAGLHTYRIRLSTLWHWFSSNKLDQLELKAETNISLTQSSLVAIED